MPLLVPSRRNVIAMASPISTSPGARVGRLADEATAVARSRERRRPPAARASTQGGRSCTSRPSRGRRRAVRRPSPRPRRSLRRRDAAGGASSRRSGSASRRSRTSTLATRADGGAAGRSGSGRRGGSRARKPRHVEEVVVGHCLGLVDGRIEPRRGGVPGDRLGRAQDDGVGSVGRGDDRMRLAWLAASSAAASPSPTSAAPA